MTTTRTTELGIAVTLVLLAIFGRLIPHAPNFAPVAGAALFAGAFLPRRWAIAVPLAAMVLSDAVIGFHNLIAVTWGSMVVSALLGFWVRKRRGATRVTFATLAGSCQFFLLTNFAVWAWGAEGAYPHTAAGLGAAYVAGLPFFRSTVAGDLFYAGALFGLYALAKVAVRRAVPASDHG